MLEWASDFPKGSWRSWSRKASPLHGRFRVLQFRACGILGPCNYPKTVARVSPVCPLINEIIQLG